MAIASQTDIYPRIAARKDRKRRGKKVLELKSGPVRGCINFSTYGMCSHTQAAALVWDVKKGYWTFLKASKKVDNNLHSLIGKIWFTRCLWEKRNPDQPRLNANKYKITR